MPTVLRWLLLVAFAASASAQTAAPAPPATPTDTAAVDSTALADSTAADSAAVAGGSAVETLSDSAAAQLDSAAVAALADTAATVTDALEEGVDVGLLGRTLFQVWGGLGNFSPEQRAERLSERLADLAQSREIDPEALRIVDGNTLTTIQVGDVIVMTVTDEDAAALGLTRTQAAERYRGLIVEGVVTYREQATLRGVLWGLAYSALALLVLVLALRALGRLFAWLDARTLSTRERYLRGVRIGTLEVVGKDQVARFGRVLVGLTRVALSLVLVYTFLTFVFGQFAWTQSWSENLLEAALTPLRQLAALLLSSIDNVIAILVIIVVVRWIMRISDYLFMRVSRGEAELKGFHAELADPTRKIVKFFLIVMGIMLIYPYTPIADNRGFQGLTVFFGLLISLGSSTAISNMVAGVVLTYTRAFRVGDRVRVGEAFGDVVEKSFLVTRIRTTKNEDISVPNANVLSNHIVNYSAMARDGSGVILHTEVTIGYDVPWPRVHQLLTQAARDTVGVEPEPPPFVLQTGLGDFSVAYQLNAYTKEVTRMARLYSDIHQHIQDRFAEAEIEILSPTYEAYREGPSTVPDAAALRDVAGRRAATTPISATDGADAAPETDPADLPDVELPTLPEVPKVHLPKFLGGGTGEDGA
ncbi:mechanosensitive ion channel family protein [Rubrivirga sp.]|uniref:mechanosensitive ion channel family protein n=1 Tax=Rubrivirga sp. TaxID=1885344 RepID=UPI003B51E995